MARLNVDEEYYERIKDAAQKKRENVGFFPNLGQDPPIPDICHFFTLAHFEFWKFYTRKVRKFTTNLPRDKTA